MPKFMFVFASARNTEDRPPTAEEKAAYERIGTWWTEHSKAGRILEGEELQSRRTAKTVRFREGKAVVTDGPYMEAKELIGGYALVELTDMSAAVELAKTWPGHSSVEVRPIVEHPQ